MTSMGTLPRGPQSPHVDRLLSTANTPKCTPGATTAEPTPPDELVHEPSDMMIVEAPVSNEQVKQSAQDDLPQIAQVAIDAYYDAQRSARGTCVLGLAGPDVQRH